MALTDKLTAIANAIREKTGSTSSMTLDEMAASISDISSDSDLAKDLIERDKTELVITALITKVGDYTFYNYSKLTNIQLPEGITTIGSFAFQNCTNLALTSLPEEITIIGEFAFNGCNNLELTSLPEGITIIRKSTFSNCAKLALTSLPEGITDIYSNAFYNCGKLAITSLPKSLTWLDNYAFEKCSGLTTITFKSKPYIASNAFKTCINLDIINVPWAEGEVANAPWGATNATINYNYTE